MKITINIYCDESCHLPNDNQKAMVLGALWCSEAKATEHNHAIAELKAKHHLSPFFEIKWTKVAPGKLDFYRDLITRLSSFLIKPNICNNILNLFDIYLIL